MSEKAREWLCPKCHGNRCPACFQTGKRLYEIG